PIPPTLTTISSSARAERGMRVSFFPALSNCSVRKRPIWGLPPPPVPRMAAPISRARISSMVRVRPMLATGQISHRFHADAGGVAGQIGQRHLLDFHDLHRLAGGASRHGPLGRLLLGVGK